MLLNKWIGFLSLSFFLVFLPGKNPLGRTQNSTPDVFQDSVISEMNFCNIENTTFVDGEEITYKLYYTVNLLWIAAGEVTFKVKEEDDQYKIVAKGRTYPSYEWFYKVRDHYESHVNKETLLPEYYMRNVEEGKYRQYNEVEFDHQENKARALKGKTKESAEAAEIPIRDCIHDVLSIIYYVRNFNFEKLEKGSTFPVEIMLDNDIYPLNVKYLGKDERKRVRGNGLFKTIVLSPEVIAGNVFKEKSQVRLWASDDENKIPLLIESPVVIGKIRAVIKEYKGLRNEFGAVVKRKGKSSDS